MQLPAIFMVVSERASSNVKFAFHSWFLEVCNINTTGLISFSFISCYLCDSKIIQDTHSFHGLIASSGSNWDPTDMGFLGLMPITILESKKIPISVISADILYVIIWCGYQICVTKICKGGRISNKLFQTSLHKQ